MEGISSVAGLSRGVDGTTAPRELSTGSGEKSFGEMLDKLSGGINSKAHSELVSLERQIVAGKSFTPRELLYFQIRAGEFNLQVELTSKAAESATSTIRRLQQG